MKHWTLRISLTLILVSGAGVVTTVAVAWACTLSASPYTPPFCSIARGHADSLTNEHLSDGLRSFHLESTGVAAVDTGSAMYVVHPRFDYKRYCDAQQDEEAVVWTHFTNYVRGTRIVVYEAGWPWRCLYAGSEHRPQRYGVMPTGVAPTIGVPRMAKSMISDDEWRKRAILPIGVRRTIVHNTLFYAAIWFILIFGWRAHLRLVRRWRGYCPMCRYDLRGDLHSGCPECGWKRDREEAANDA